MSNKTNNNNKKKKKKKKEERIRELERVSFFFRLNRRKRDVYLCLIFAIDLPKD